LSSVNPTHLLDTSIFLWAVDSPEKLSSAAQMICQRGDLNPCVSVISLMELIVKSQKGHLQLTPDPLQWWDNSVKLYGFAVLPVRQNHVQRLWALPRIHKDPADRLLIAQAIAEGIPLVTSDDTIRQYPVEAIW
jgi:PIN domain nuclease of toxin-antitoxin system